MRIHIWLLLTIALLILCQFNANPQSHDLQNQGSGLHWSNVSIRDDEIDDDGFEDHVIPFLKKYCFDCHSGDLAESEVDLESFKNTESVRANTGKWQLIEKAISDHFMPPDDSLQPNDRDRRKMVEWIRKTIGNESVGNEPLVSIRRLTQFEYENTIRDLFRMSRHAFNNPNRIIQSDDYFNPESGVMSKQIFAPSIFSVAQYTNFELEGVPSPPLDRPGEHGFNNEAELLTLSPIMIEKYFRIANGILDSKTTPRISSLWKSLFSIKSDLDTNEINAIAHSRLSSFIDRAFRREASADEKEVYFLLFTNEYNKSSDFIASMKTTIAAILVSPQFLFRFDISGDSKSSPMDEHYKIASRLSYFLWCSMPDDELFQAAKEKRLADISEIRKQIRRMLKDRKVKSFAADFANQWLKLQSVTTSTPDPEKFAWFYGRKNNPYAVSMMIEQLLLFETILVEDRSVMEFIHADFAYLNYDLILYYGFNFEDALGFKPEKELFEDFYRVEIGHKMRGGIITSGATLVLTSTTTRTSPVNRGVWILNAVLNRPPSPPPANVPPLEETNPGSQRPLSIRERTAMHRDNPNCAVCHDRIDPLGFALEQFDAVGKYRAVYENGDPVDATGKFRGQDFTSAAQFKLLLLQDKTTFVRAFTKHMLRYALGRKLNYNDEPHIDLIVENVLRRECRFSSVVEYIVLSDLFLQTTPKKQLQQ